LAGDGLLNDVVANLRLIGCLGGRTAAGKMMIDWSRVNELRDEIGAEDFDNVAEMFLEEADEVIARMAPQDSAKSVEADLHFLKGAALNLGFSAFAALCQDGERRAGQGDAGLDLDAVKLCYAASKVALAKGVSKADAA
jgi:histidine phosphotransfer protein HptB